MDWLKLYNSIIYNVRFHELSHITFRVLILTWLYCSTKKPYGECIYNMKQMSYSFQISVPELENSFVELIKADFLKKQDDKIIVVNWDQYQTSINTIKSRKYREAKKDATEMHPTAPQCTNRREEIREDEKRKEEIIDSVANIFLNLSGEEISDPEKIFLTKEIQETSFNETAFLDSINIAFQENEKPNLITHVMPIYKKLSEDIKKTEKLSKETLQELIKNQINKLGK